MDRLLKTHNCSELEGHLLRDLHAALIGNPDMAKPVTEILRHHVVNSIRFCTQMFRSRKMVMLHAMKRITVLY